MPEISIFLSEEDWRAIRDVAKALGYFVKGGMFNYIDRIGDSYSSTSAIAAIRDALRALQSARSQGEKVHIPSPHSVEHVVKLLGKNIRVGYIISALALTYGGISVREELEKEGGG